MIACLVYYLMNFDFGQLQMNFDLFRSDVASVDRLLSVLRY